MTCNKNSKRFLSVVDGNKDWQIGLEFDRNWDIDAIFVLDVGWIILKWIGWGKLDKLICWIGWVL